MEFIESCYFTNSHSNRKKMKSKHNIGDNIYCAQIVGKSIIKSQDVNDILPTKKIAVDSHEFNILTDCQKCYKKLKDPITLSCGFTLCYSCIPKTSQFQCMSFSCLRTHENTTKRTNFILKDILATTSVSQIQNLLHCSVCLQPFNEPITTECGHTFCKECLIRIMIDLKNRACPICRHELSRIGKINHLLSHWTQFVIGKANKQDLITSVTSEYIPIIQLNTVVMFPTQHFVFHINRHNNQSLFKEMIRNPYQHHYALCLFYSQRDKHHYNYGIMVKINHIEYSSDIQHSVIQAYGLFRLNIHQLIQDGHHTYTSSVTRLEDMSSNTMHRSLSTPSTTQPLQLEQKPMSMVRPWTLKLSYSVPPYHSMHQYHSRKARVSGMQFHKQPPTDSAHNVNPTTDMAFIDDLRLKSELDRRVQAYLCTSPELFLKYECYSEQDIEYVWWLCTILPLNQTNKIHLFSLLSQRDRIIAIIGYMDKELLL